MKKNKQILDLKLSFEKMTIVSLNKEELVKIKGGGFPVQEKMSDQPSSVPGNVGCDQNNTV